ncbi:MAG: hypothetical protein ACK559_23925, partial [bacterium]
PGAAAAELDRGGEADSVGGAGDEHAAAGDGADGAWGGHGVLRGGRAIPAPGPREGPRSAPAGQLQRRADGEAARDGDAVELRQLLGARSVAELAGRDGPQRVARAHR